MASSESEEAMRQEQSHMFVFLVDCRLTVEEGEWPLDVLKEAAQLIIDIAGRNWRSTFALGKLDGTGPYLPPNNLPRTWREKSEYIKVQGDPLRLVDIPGRRVTNLCVTIGLAGNEPLDELDITDIGIEIMMRGIRFVDVKPRPASMNEVEAKVNE